MVKLTVLVCAGWIGLMSANAAIQVPGPGQMAKGKYSYAWSVCDTCSEPESAYYDPEAKVIFVSNVVGDPTAKDGQGWIQKLDVSGKVIDAKWVTGLSAPKGMRSYKGVLWVSNIDEIVSIDIASAKILKRYPVKDAKFLNDVAIDSEGTVYVSDMLGDHIVQVKNDTVSTFVKGSLDAPNGLLVVGDDLVVASWGVPAADWSTKVPGKLYKISLKTKSKRDISKKPLGNLDGLETNGQGDFFVTDWMAGKVYRVASTGDAVELFTGMKGSADIGYLQEEQLLVIPRMGEKQITAYDLTKYPATAASAVSKKSMKKPDGTGKKK